MTVAGAAPGGDGQDFALVQLDGLGGGQVVGGQNDRNIRVNAPFGHAGEEVHQPAGHVPHVGRPGLHVGVVHSGQHGGELLPGLLGGVLGGVPRFQLFLHGAGEILVLQKHGVGFKQCGGIVAGLDSGLLRHALQLLHGLGSGGLQPSPLRRRVPGHLLLHRSTDPVIEAENALFNAFGHALAL